MMKDFSLGKWITTTSALALFATWALAAEPTAAPKAATTHDEHKAAGEVKKMDGEILDLHCFMLHPDNGQGADHSKCAEMCINKGLPVGFRSTTGEIYLVLGAGHESVKSLVAEHAGTPVRIEGVIVEHDGVRALQLQKVEDLSQGPAVKKPASESSHNH
jgi:hypothetical protein